MAGRRKKSGRSDRETAPAEAGERASLTQEGKLLVGKSEKPEYLTLRLANRHGLVAGATGTGKTVTLQVMAEGFSRAGVPVFAADIKGDLSGIAARGEDKDFLIKRAADIGFTYEADQFPVVFWDLFGEQGHPIRTTVFEMGPLLLSRMLGLNDVQEGVVNIAFRFADDEFASTDAENKGLVDLKDFRELLAYLADNAKDIGAKYGNVSGATVGAVQRQLLVLENQGGAKFFGEPALSITDFMRTDSNGRGVINILSAEKLMENPQLYATFLLWMLSELFEEMPEVGDLDKPKLVFFFDEAHLLFDDAPKALLDKIEQVVRLIRSKGVGVYFVSQNPLDIPNDVLAQLGNRVQHALRAFTPRDQKAVRAAADTFRQNPKLDTEQVITQLSTGEALVSFLEGKGTPSVVERTLICPPASRIGPITAVERSAVMNASPLRGRYDKTIDPESAYEILQQRIKVAAEAEKAPEQQPESGGSEGGLGGILGGILGGGSSHGRSRRMSTTEVAVKQIARSVASQVGTQIGRALVRGILGSLGRK
jgi:DNA helicase HerA-like ATPase